MTIEEAIYELERMKTWSKELSDEEIEAIVIALKALSSLENPNKWIPVSERVPLPEPYKAESEEEEKHD